MTLLQTLKPTTGLMQENHVMIKVRLVDFACHFCLQLRSVYSKLLQMKTAEEVFITFCAPFARKNLTRPQEFRAANELNY